MSKKDNERILKSLDHAQEAFDDVISNLRIAISSATANVEPEATKPMYVPSKKQIREAVQRLEGETGINPRNWIKHHFGWYAQVIPYCLCGRRMGSEEYLYEGGSHGKYTCSSCARIWVTTGNGAMWEPIYEVVDLYAGLVHRLLDRVNKDKGINLASALDQSAEIEEYMKGWYGKQISEGNKSTEDSRNEES